MNMQCNTIQHASEFWLVGITITYLFFALQVVFQARWVRVNRRAAFAAGSLVTVFIFCSQSGYLSSLLPADWWYFREGLHAVLFSASLVLIKTNQAGVIARMLELENSKLDERK